MYKILILIAVAIACFTWYNRGILSLEAIIGVVALEMWIIAALITRVFDLNKLKSKSPYDFYSELLALRCDLQSGKIKGFVEEKLAFVLNMESLVIKMEKLTRELHIPETLTGTVGGNFVSLQTGKFFFKTEQTGMTRVDVYKDKEWLGSVNISNDDAERLEGVYRKIIDRRGT